MFVKVEEINLLEANNRCRTLQIHEKRLTVVSQVEPRQLALDSLFTFHGIMNK